MPGSKLLSGKLRNQKPYTYFFIEEFQEARDQVADAGIVRRSVRYSDPDDKKTRPAAQIEIIRHDLSGRLMHASQCEIKSGDQIECVSWTSAYCNRTRSLARGSGLEVSDPEHIRAFSKNKNSRVGQLWEKLRRPSASEDTLLSFAQGDAQKILEYTERQFESRGRLTFLLRGPQLRDLNTKMTDRQIPPGVHAFTRAMEICSELATRHGGWSHPQSGYMPLPTSPEPRAAPPGTI